MLPAQIAWYTVGLMVNLAILYAAFLVIKFVRKQVKLVNLEMETAVKRKEHTEKMIKRFLQEDEENSS